VELQLPGAASGAVRLEAGGRARVPWGRIRVPTSATPRSARYNPPVPHSHDHFAPHFDAWQRAFGGAYDDLILPRLLHALARAGYAVVGVDRSPAMLEVARVKIATLPPPPLLLQQDLRALRLDAAADATEGGGRAEIGN